MKTIIIYFNQYLSFFPLMIIYFYRFCISPFLPHHCRFYPSCSKYFCEAFKKKGFFKGFKLSIIRLCKCHPWHEGGFDYVSDNDEG